MSSCRSCSHRAHPRSRGENGHGRRFHLRPRGSSPLTRGKPEEGDGRAGADVAHPRSRGENPVPPLTGISILGSSPLTRGKPHRVRLAPRGLGLIPAHAGKTPRSERRCPPRRAHPRSRGENPVLHFTAACRAGSSPLTRGKPRPSANGTRTMGLIPAHAGKTTTLLGTLAASRAHPRSRGENRRAAFHRFER